MYHPFQNQEAQRTMKDRRSHADMTRRIDRQRVDRGNPLGLILARLIARMSDSFRHESQTQQTARSQSTLATGTK